jgi:hypothetical protein
MLACLLAVLMMDSCSFLSIGPRATGSLSQILVTIVFMKRVLTTSSQSAYLKKILFLFG